MTQAQQARPATASPGRRFHAYTARHLDALAKRAGLSAAERLAVQAVATVLPFRTNDYVVEQLIDWDAAPDDPIYRLVFPQQDMLPSADVRFIAGLLAGGAPDSEVRAAAHAVRMRLNPHPAGQLALNIPEIADEPLPDPQLSHIESIRVGTKSLAYWPQRFVTDPDADDTLRLFEEVGTAGKCLALMAHFSPPRELEPALVGQAVRRISSAGAVIRTQAPLIASINDDPATWSSMWRAQVRMGMMPYYMFVERDTGPQGYFAVPLARAYEVFRDAYSSVSGLSRTV